MIKTFLKSCKIDFFLKDKLARQLDPLGEGSGRAKIISPKVPPRSS
jgi:hypothetical protein